MGWESSSGFEIDVGNHIEDSVDGPRRIDNSKEPEQQSKTTLSRNGALASPPLTLASSVTIDPLTRLRAIMIAKMPGGRAKGGILGAAVAARVLALREDTVRGWMKREDAIREEAEVLGIDIEMLAASLPKVYPPPVHMISNSHLTPIVDEQLKRWILLYLEESKDKIMHYTYAVNKAREFDPHFMPCPSDSATQEEKTAYANRARNWFSRFCNRHRIELAKVSKGGTHTNRGLVFTNEFKLRAIDMVREQVEGGRGPDGTRGKKAVARMLGISTHALRNWEGKEEELRKKSREWKASASALHTDSSSSLTTLPSALISPMPSSMLDLQKPSSGLIESPTVLSSTEHALPPHFSAWQALSVAPTPLDSECFQQQKEYNLQHENLQHQPLRVEQASNVSNDGQAPPPPCIDTVSGLKGSQQMI